jgi:CRP/FNR family transcriptional regulator, cyclic AMP receptor protein
MSQRRIRRGERIKLLRGIELFAGCNTTELGRISSLTTEHCLGAGTVLTRQGEPGLEAFVMIEGAASARRNDRTVAELGPGSLFGELALLDGDRRTATVVADTDVRLLVLSRREFASLLAVAPSVGQKIIGQLGRRLRMTDELLDSVPSAAMAIGPISV